MDFWTGDVLLEDASKLENITFSSQHIVSASSLPFTPLRFLSLVETARIPLYLAAGPSWDVWTTSPATEEWFNTILARENALDATASAKGNRAWWTASRAQSLTGILVEVQNGWEIDGAPRITEILFYGTLAPSPDVGLPTPPTDGDVGITMPQLRVHALPLSSDLLRSTIADLPPSPALATENGREDAHFLPLHPAKSPSPGPEKRKKTNDMDEMFNEATERRRKARRKGGAAVAAAASKIEPPRPTSAHRNSLSIDNNGKAGNTNDTLRSQPPQTIIGRPLSRSPSFSSDIRPLSRKGLLDGPAKRSTLSRVTSMSTAPEEQTMEARNKDALSRVVMAGMRMYGLTQRKKISKSRRSSVAPSADGNEGLADEQAAEEAIRDEDYKLVYHQAFKGAALALRKHITTEPLHSQPDSLRDVVDRLLAIFCTDPLVEAVPSAEPVELLSTPGRRGLLGEVGSARSHKSPFDSIKRSEAMLQVRGEGGFVNSPSTRKGNRDAG